MENRQEVEHLQNLADPMEKIRQYLQIFYAKNPFVRFLDLRLGSIESGKIRLEMFVAENLLNMYNIAHGGATMSLADTAMGAACLSVGKRVVTLECSSTFIKGPASGEDIYAIGTVVHNGSRTMVCAAEVYNSADELCLRAQGSFFVLEKIPWDRLNLDEVGK